MAVSARGLDISKLEGSKNFHTWYINVRALLRREGLWIFANSSKDELEETAAYHEYDRKVIDAADLITPHVSDLLKAQMPTEIFDHGYLLLERLREQYQAQSVIHDEQTRPEDPQDTSSDKLSSLPPELRNIIYGFVLLEQRQHSLQGFHSKTSEEPALLRVCKQIRKEASPVYYGNMDVTASIDLNQTSKELSRCVRQIQELIANCGPKPFKTFTIVLRGSFWDHLDDFLPLLELMRETAFEPATRDYDSSHDRWFEGSFYTKNTSIFRMPANNMVHAQLVLEMALRLARRARAEGWDKARLALRFQEFVTEQRRPTRRGKHLPIMVEGKAL